MQDLDRPRPLRGASDASLLTLALAVLLVVLALLSSPRAAAGQDGFLFGPPKGTITLRAGPMLYTAGGDLFAALREDLTLDRTDFRAPALGLDVVIPASSRLDVVFGIGYSQASPRSEFRDWVDQDDLPIEQVTRLQSVPLTATLRYLPMPRGRSVSSVAWLPRSTTPYVGAGGGAMWYRLRQRGEFVDFSDNRIFSDTIEDSGWHAVAHALAGMDHWFTPRLGVNVEARYTHGRAQADNGFRTFDRLDTSGVQATVGFSVRW